MIAPVSVYLTADRSKAVPHGDKDAAILLVRQGCDISEGEIAKHKGADKVLKGEAQPQPVAQPPALRNQHDVELEDDEDEPKVAHRKPKTVHHESPKLKKR